MIGLATPEIWLVCGSQHLYGPGPLEQVAAHAREIAGALGASPKLPLKTQFKALLTTPDEIARLCLEANSDPDCAGLILWMHTFSPSKMWVRGLNALQKPFVHLHTQFGRDLPWDTIDMDFMNLNQSAHGDREAGFIHTRMRLPRKVVVGHWSDPEVQDRIGAWMRAARAWADWQGAKFCRFGDNMRQVAVTEGDKVARRNEIRLRCQHAMASATSPMRWTPSPTPKSRRWQTSTRSATRSRRSCASRAPDTNRFCMARGLNSACAPSLSKAASRVSPPPSRTCMASSSCRASRRSA